MLPRLAKLVQYKRALALALDVLDEMKYFDAPLPTMEMVRKRAALEQLRKELM